MNRFNCLMFFLFLTSYIQANIIYVDVDATGNNNGTSWTNAYNRLQNALINANSGDDIWVAEGVYYPAYIASASYLHIDSTFLVPNGVNLYGGFDGTESNLNQRNLRDNSTILNGDISQDDPQHAVRSLATGLTNSTISSYNVYHVVTFNGSNSIIDGFHIINGGSKWKEINTSSTSDGSSSNQGGGTDGNATAGNPGTGFPVTFPVDIPGPNNNGGGIYVTNNSNITIRNVFFKRNLAQNFGAAVFVGNQCTATIENSIFTENYVTSAGIVHGDTNSVCNIIHCTFYNNRGGKGLYSGVNAVYEIANSILWDVGANIRTSNSIGGISGSITYNDFGGSNSQNNPLLFKPDHYNFEPISCSPAVNNPTINSFFALATDFYGEPRTGTADIGAIEFKTASLPTNNGNIVYVDKYAIGNNDGTSWTNAFTRINEALLSAACNNINQIWIADGIYLTSDSTMFNAFHLNNSISLYGGFSGSETSLNQRDIANNETTISGDILNNDTGFGIPANIRPLDNSINLLIASPTSAQNIIIDGITITENRTKNIGAWESGVLNLARSNNGGDVNYKNCSFQSLFGPIRNSVVSQYINTSAITNPKSLNINFDESSFRYNSSFKTNAFDSTTLNITINGCFFEDTPSDILCKQMANIQFDIDSCIFEEKGIQVEGHSEGLIDLSINETRFEETEALGNTDPLAGVGGALDIRDYGGLTNISIDKSYFFKNIANTGGGAIGVFARNTFYATNQSAGTINLAIDHSVFKENISTQGACVFINSDSTAAINLTVKDALIHNNAVSSQGGFLYVAHNGGSVTNTITNTTIANNLSADSAAVISQKDFTNNFGSVTTTFNNSIFYDNYSNATINNGVYSASILNPKFSVYNHPNLDLNFNFCNIDTTHCYANATCGLGMQYNLDPNFVSPSGNIYNLGPASPAINAGSNVYAFGNALDLQDSSRVQNGTIDIGCYEGEFICALDSVVYVNKLATGLNDGSSWDNAFTNLPDAFTKARDCNLVKEIWVAEGMYYPSLDSNVNDYLHIHRTKLKVYGGFPNAGSPSFMQRDFQVYPTVISGDLQGDNTAGSLASAEFTDNAEIIMILENTDSTVIISGFIFEFAPAITIRNINTLDNSINENPIIEDCEFRYSRDGLLFLLSQNSDKMPAPIINRCSFHTSSDDFGGTAVYAAILDPSVGFGNSAVVNPDTIVIANSLFYNLNATKINYGYGGAIYALSEGTPQLPMTIKNSTLFDVIAREAPVLYANNASIKVENSIAWKNAKWFTLNPNDDQFFANNSTISFYNSSIAGSNCLDKNGTSNGGTISCYGNMFYDIDPLFSDETIFDLKLQSNSPLIDEGDNSLVFGNLDFGLNPRIEDANVELGAYEFPSCIPTADFISNQANPTIQNIDFSNNAINADSILYDFGDGNTSTQNNPSHTYSSSGSYVVCLQAFGACGNDTICKIVDVVCQKPTADFTFIQADPIIQNIDFSDNAINADSILYDFGDGNTSTQNNPSHTYSSSGSYVVCLQAFGACGNDTICKIVDVVCQKPTADFTFIQTDSTIQDIDFSNNAINADSILYDFGDGNTSTQNNPLHTYSSTGSYTVCLQAFGACGNDTICKIVDVVCQKPTADFFYTQNNPFLPTAEFTDASINADSVFYDFGDGNTSYLRNPTHHYSNGGVYLVSQLAFGVCGVDTIIQTIGLACFTPTASFQYTALQSNKFEFNSTALNADSVFYDFGDGNSTNIFSPIHEYTQAGSFTVCQIAYNFCGADTSCLLVEVCGTQSIIYVNKSANGNNNGTSWADAFESMDDAVNFVNTCDIANEIWVAEGMYRPGATNDINRDTSFHFKNLDSVSIYGGFPKAGNPTFADRDIQVFETIFNGDIGVANDSLDNCYNILYLENINNVIVDGITIEEANSDFGALEPGALVAGFNNFVGNHYAYLKMENCVFQNNFSEYGPAGALIDADSVFINHTHFYNNKSHSSGGAFSCNVNSAQGSLEIRNSIFLGNKVSTQGLFGNGGGSINIGGGGVTKLFNTQFIENESLDLFGAPNPGGAIRQTFGSIYAENCLFLNNKAGDGGALDLHRAAGEFRHCTFYGNQANQGGNVISSNQEDVLIRNSIVWNNTTLPFGFSEMFSTFNNNEIQFDASFIDLPNCNPLGFDAQCLGANQFNVYPEFVDTNVLDLRLKTCSPAIDFSNPINSTNIDLDGNQRPFGFLPDAGAYEWNGDLNFEIFSDTNITTNITQIAEFSFTDTLGWTHYYDCDSQNLLLSILLDGEDIGMLGAGLDIGVVIDTNYATGNAQNLNNANFHSENHFYAMNRSWYVNTFFQPFNPVKVRFYFDGIHDFDDVAITYNDSIGSIAINSIQDLVFYKLSNTQNAYDSSIATNDAIIYDWANTSSLTSWTNGTFNGLSFAEFEVNSFSAGSGAASSRTNLLPVELINLYAKPVDNEFIQVNWQTLTEVNNDGFEVYKSIDGVNYEEIEWIEGAGNSIDLKTYYYNDYNVVSGVNYYYRLKQVDFNNHIEWSNIVSAQIDEFTSNSIKIYPIPSDDIINIEFLKTIPKDFSIKVLNSIGQEVYEIDNSNEIDLSNYSKGVYTLLILFNEEIHQTKIILR